jgi:hypothetical protein
MEIIIAIIIVLGFVIWFYNRKSGPDVNNDGKVDIEDAKAAVQKAATAVKADAVKAKTAVKAAAKSVKKPGAKKK